MTKTTLNNVTKALTKVEITRGKIAKLRDTLRSQVEDVNDILDSLEESMDLFDEGRRAFDDGLDALSKYL
jgi:ABC-type transporter Mla subunit MlaD